MAERRSNQLSHQGKYTYYGMTLKSFSDSLKRICVTSWAQLARFQEVFESPRKVITELCDLKVAFVKQSVYTDLYANPNAGSPLEIIASSNFRSGPVGLMQTLRADYYIVNVEPDTECRIWEEKRKTVIFVTHNIPEAILLGDRVIVFSERPGRIMADITIEIERPRGIEIKSEKRFGELEVEIYNLIASAQTGG